MRFSTFATSCVAVATYPGITLAAPLPGAPHQYEADSLAQNQISAQNQINAQADAEAEGMFDWVTDIYEHFVPPKTEFFDEVVGSDEPPKLQDELQVAMEDLLYEVGSKEILWSSKAQMSQHGWPHDYCSYEKYLSAETEVVASGLRKKLNSLYLVLVKYELGKVEAMKEVDLKKNKDITREQYTLNFAAAIDVIKRQVDIGSDLLQRDADENDTAARKKKFEEVLGAAHDLTGLHRGRLAVTNAWARKLITDSCNRQGKDKLDLYGVLYQGALAAIPHAVGGLTKALGGDESTANSLAAIADMIAKVTGMGTPEDQVVGLNKLSEEIGIDSGILSALSTTDPEALQKAAEQFGDKKVSEAIYKIQSSSVVHDIQTFSMDDVVKGALQSPKQQSSQKPKNPDSPHKKAEPNQDTPHKKGHNKK